MGTYTRTYGGHTGDTQGDVHTPCLSLWVCVPYVPTPLREIGSVQAFQSPETARGLVVLLKGQLVGAEQVAHGML